MVWKNLFDQLGSAVQAECPPNFLRTPSPLAGGQHEKQRAPGCCVNTAQQWLKHWYLINTVLVTSLKHSTMQPCRLQGRKLTLYQPDPVQQVNDYLDFTVTVW